MRKANCTTCNAAAPVSSLYTVDGAIYCEPCANQRYDQIKAAGGVSDVLTATDPTICARCGLDNGNNELLKTAGLPLCMPCTQAVMERPFPTWLKASLVFLFALLFVALWHGRSYFKTGKLLVRGERLVDQQRYAEAIPYLQPAALSAPGCEKCILLLAKAQLLSGDVEGADKTLGNRQEFEKSELADEVAGIWDRVDQATKIADAATKLAEQKKDEEAAKKMREAAAIFPEMKSLSIAAEAYEGGAAFDRKDYAGFEKSAESVWKADPKSPDAAATLASALACQYAVSGDASYRQRAEQFLEQARVLAQSSSQDQQDYQEYAERIRYRLESREIIDRDEYNRRFRKASPPQGKG
jgi:hypothetical protein